MASDPIEAKKAKRELRATADANRRCLVGKDALSRLICDTLASLPQYTAAGTLLVYVDFGDEVRTGGLLHRALGERKRVVLPYCAGDVLQLFRIDAFDELSPGTWGILEPNAAVREQADRRISIEEVDFVIVPGVAFDRRGGRLGHGKGYYDKLLASARPATALVAVAFECQLFDRIPMLPHDVGMDMVITEAAVYRAADRTR